MISDKEHASGVFTNALEQHSPRYGVTLDQDAITDLTKYFELLRAWNPRLHLVAPCGPAEFATRHVLESLTALRYLLDNARIADIGSGGGLPIIPCLLVNLSLQAKLIESSQKKGVFLREALRLQRENKNSIVLVQRFEQTPTPDVQFVTCRALERFEKMFKTILKWSPSNSTLLLFGGSNLKEEIIKASIKFESVQMPDSTQRFLFVIRPRTLEFSY